MVRGVGTVLDGWGGTTPGTCTAYRPDDTGGLRDLVGESGSPDLIARGMGRSYGDPAVNADGGVVLTERLDRLLDFDPATGDVTCEAGVTIHDVVRTFLPRGFFPSVTPGTRHVTVGGAIAADVHGKNQHVDGNFGDHVEWFDLLTASGTVLRCSRTDNTEVFRATVGGMGLTGILTAARFRLRRVASSKVEVETIHARDLDHALELFDSDSEHRYSVAWIDVLARGGKTGRSVLMRGDHAPAGDDPRPLARPERRTITMPFHMPGFVLDGWTVRTFNSLYRSTRRAGRSRVALDPYFYPLDGLARWNRMYGRRGFVQYQPLFPDSTARAGLRDVLDILSTRGAGSFLAVLKRCADRGEGMLSFPMRGVTLALDIPNRPGLRDILRDLDAAVLRHGGRLYLAKDAAMSADTFATMYPRLPEFLGVRDRLDPDRRWSSSQARRLGIAPQR